MDRKKLYYSAPNLLSLCVDWEEGGQIQGRIYHRYTRGPVRFDGFGQIVSMMEELFDRIGYPQAATSDREFGKGKREQTQTPPRKREKAEEVTSADDIIDQTGKMATFIVHVQYRQYATWQGNVVWAEMEQSSNFRSALELFKLMDSALAQKRAGYGDAGIE